MDFTDLVHARSISKVILFALRSPGIHFLAIGLALYGVASLGFFGDLADTEGTQRFTIPASKVMVERMDREALLKRPLHREEAEQMREHLIDQEILFQHALQLGLDKDPAVERRLAKIAAFVSENPHEIDHSDAAGEARALGLLADDIVVRRILIDAAKRLIQGAIRIREPSEDLLRAYLAKHPNEFRVPSSFSFSQIALSKVHRSETLQSDFRQILERLQSEGSGPQEALRIGDSEYLPIKSEYNEIREQDIRRIFGSNFSIRLKTLPNGSWHGPIESRYGIHLVYLNERTEAEPPVLEECREKVRSRVVDLLAEQWLDIRLAQLREMIHIEIQEDTGA